MHTIFQSFSSISIGYGNGFENGNRERATEREKSAVGVHPGQGE